jgi:2-polyprenyl-3-methyl-5-hydroxy-6-metoxy-1,4-benzoquinol methylase
MTLASRSYQAELMDDLNGGGESMTQTLDELEVINTWLGGYNVTLNGISTLLKDVTGFMTRPFSVADLGCGGGDGLRVMSRWAKRQGLPLHFTGIDANPFIIEYAKNKSVVYPDIAYRQMDIFSEDFLFEQYDIINCSLFCHHFDEKELTDLLMRMRALARIGIIINDLHRHWFAYHSIKLITQIFSHSRLIKNDAPLSVKRAFKKKELQELLENAGIRNYTIKWMWAFRWQVIIYP